MIHLHEMLSKSQRQKIRMVAAQNVGRESYCLIDREFQFCKRKKFLEMDGSDGCTTKYT